MSSRSDWSVDMVAADFVAVRPRLSPFRWAFTDRFTASALFRFAWVVQGIATGMPSPAVGQTVVGVLAAGDRKLRLTVLDSPDGIEVEHHADGHA